MTLAVLLIDLQRDFISTDGAYARGGVTSPVIASPAGPAAAIGGGGARPPAWR